MNTALMTAMSGASFDEARSDAALWGRIVESAVGAHFAAFTLRDGSSEVDFVTLRGRAVMAVEVKSGATPDYRGLEVFRTRFPGSDTLLVGAGGTALETFLAGTA
jgi:predicted AAA+ superfamily ATPase